VDAASHFTQYGLYAGSALYCFVGGLVPVFNIEAYLLVLASTTDASRHWEVLTLVATGAHMAAKSLLYASGRGVSSGIPKRHQARIELVRQRLARWRYGRAGFVFVSALTGFPPFYALAILAGMLRFGFVRFLGAGSLGRFLRFAAFLLFPQLCRRLLDAL
jgi:membrane protein YqaA with SNARE-associated domain